MAGIRKIEVLRNQETGFFAHSLPDVRIRPPSQIFIRHGMYVVTVRGKNTDQSNR